MHSRFLAAVVSIGVTGSLWAAPAAATQPLPRTADGKPNFSGIWQAAGSAEGGLQDHASAFNMPAGRSVVAGGEIPYQPWAAAKKAANFKNRQTADPLAQCYIPGVPRVMYLNFPFQIFQTPKMIAIAFEWSLDHRQLFLDGSKHPADYESWMGDSRAHWEGETLVVDVANMNDKTWLDMAGDFHSDAMHVVERYHLTDADTIQYEATIEDSKVFSKPWTIRLPLRRRTDRTRLSEYSCQADAEERKGDFTPEKRTWYPGDGTAAPGFAALAARTAEAGKAPAGFPRTSEGKPDLQGFYEGGAGGANQGLEKRPATELLPTRAGIIVDPVDGILPLKPWAAAERDSRNLPERGYDDPTAHCFPQGVPRAMYVPQGIQVVQTPDYIVFLFERMSWRIVAMKGRPHLPAGTRLWQGDSVGRWEGDTLVVDTTNFNGKTWLNEYGDVVSYAEHVVERFTPTTPNTVTYAATIIDPVVYTKPWTMSFPLTRDKFEVTEAACHEEDRDLPHLKSIRDAAARRKKK